MIHTHLRHFLWQRVNVDGMTASADRILELPRCYYVSPIERILANDMPCFTHADIRYMRHVT